MADKGAPSNPFDFSQDEDFHPLFFQTATAEQAKDFARWLAHNKNAFVKLYHGTWAGHDVMSQGLKPTTTARRNSYQSSNGYVCLSAYPGLARAFGNHAAMNRGATSDGARVAVYPVVLNLRSLLADKDQLNNQRYAGNHVANSLAHSLLYGHGVRVRGIISPDCILAPLRYADTRASEPMQDGACTTHRG